MSLIEYVRRYPTFWKTEFLEGVLVASIPFLLGVIFFLIAWKAFVRVGMWRAQISGLHEKIQAPIDINLHRVLRSENDRLSAIIKEEQARPYILLNHEGKFYKCYEIRPMKVGEDVQS